MLPRVELCEVHALGGDAQPEQQAIAKVAGQRFERRQPLRGDGRVVGVARKQKGGLAVALAVVQPEVGLARVQVGQQLLIRHRGTAAGDACGQNLPVLLLELAGFLDIDQVALEGLDLLGVVHAEQEDLAAVDVAVLLAVPQPGGALGQHLPLEGGHRRRRQALAGFPDHRRDRAWVFGHRGVNLLHTRAAFAAVGRALDDYLTSTGSKQLRVSAVWLEGLGAGLERGDAGGRLNQKLAGRLQAARGGHLRRCSQRVASHAVPGVGVDGLDDGRLRDCELVAVLLRLVRLEQLGEHGVAGPPLVDLLVQHAVAVDTPCEL